MCGCWPAGEGTACCIGDWGAEPCCFWEPGGVGAVVVGAAVTGILADAVGNSEGFPPRPAAVWGDAGG